MKKNCWEFKGCGREPNGIRAGVMGICPASTDSRLDGTHGGRHAGRACWVVAGTYCGGEVQGTYAHKFDSCMSCDFFKTVRTEEGSGFEMSIVLLNRIRAFNIEI